MRASPRIAALLLSACLLGGCASVRAAFGPLFGPEREGDVEPPSEETAAPPDAEEGEEEEEPGAPYAAPDAEAPEALTEPERGPELPDYTLPAPEEVIAFGPPQPAFHIQDNERIRAVIRRFQRGDRGFIQRSAERGKRYLAMIQRVFEAHGLPRELAALAMVESGFNPRARSWAGAVGMWQFMAPTGALYGLRVDHWIDERRDPLKATIAAARHLKDLHEYYRAWPLALAAYNAGMGTVNRAINACGTNDFWEFTRRCRIKKETFDYVPRFYAALHVLTNPEAFGFDPLIPNKEETYDYAVISDLTDLRAVAAAAETDYETIQDLNPELRRWCTPPAPFSYRVRLPDGASPRFARNFAKLPPHERTPYRLHRVARGETPTSVARRYGVSVRELLALNDLPPRARLTAGQPLVAPARGAAAGARDRAVSAEDFVARDTRLVALPPSGVHVVRKGESLARIANRYNLRLDRLLALNGLTRRSTIRPGDRIVLADIRLTPTKSAPVDGPKYRIRPGDTLWSIARSHGLTTAELARCNNRGERDALIAGREIRLCPSSQAVIEAPRRTATPSSAARSAPATASLSAPASEAKPRPRHHIVAAGETLWGIAREHSVRVEDLRRWNGLGKKSTLKPGARLRVAPR